ncbi:hypothetical protein MOC30_14265 [Bacillus spizizenii]|nr:hypothetical protein [Bacillus spizizenii]
MRKRLKKKLFKKLLEGIPEGYGVITKESDDSFYHGFKKGEIVRFEKFDDVNIDGYVSASSLINRNYIQVIPSNWILLNLGGGQVG